MNNLATVPIAGLSTPAPASPPIAETLQVLLTAAWRQRYLIVTPMLFLPVLGGIAGHFAPKTYETKMTILIQEPGKLNPFLEDLSVKTNLKDRMPALSSLLTSRHVMQSVAADLGMIHPDSKEKLIDDVVADLASAVSVQLIGQELVELRYKAATPADIDKVLMRIGERFMERVEAPEDSSMRNSVSFLDKELTDARKRLEDAEAAVAEYRAKNSQSLPDQRAGNLQRLTTLRDSLAEHEVKLVGAQTDFDTTRARLSQTDPVIGRLEQDIVTARGDLAVLRSRYTDEHSKVQAKLRELQRLEDERARLVAAGQQAPPADIERMWNMAAVAHKEGDGSQPLLVSQVAMLEAARTRLQEVQSETENLRRSVAELSAAVEASGDVERELDKRQRTVTETLDLVQSLQKRFEMAKVTGELSRFQAPERIKVIDKPTVPTKPMKPLTILFAVGGLVGGLFLGAGLAVLIEMSDTTVRRIRQMEKLTGVPVLGRLAVAEGEAAMASPGAADSVLDGRRWTAARAGLSGRMAGFRASARRLTSRALSRHALARFGAMAGAAVSEAGRLAKTIRSRIFRCR
jgi:polysaccharide chain length determinant protein (PEP-CTERM system associated)